MTTPRPLLERLTRGDFSIIFYISLVRLLFHLALNATGGYGLFRDELYYLACADHLAMGYVDHPAFSIYVLKFFTAVFGDSLFAIRLAPALCGAVSVFLTGLITIRLGGGRYAQLLACVCTFSFINIGICTVFSMNSIDLLCWTATAYIMLRIIQEEKKLLWITLGFVLGIGLMNKIGMLFLGAGLFLGLLFTPQRRWFTTVWPYIAGAIAFILFLPFVIWNVQHDMAHLEFIHNASSNKYSGLSPITFLRSQFMDNNPIASVVWITGLFALLFHPALRQFRMLAFLYLGPLMILLLNGTSKGEYLAPGYAILWAAGGVWWERIFASLRYGKIIKPILPALIIVMMITFLPMAAPVLPVEKFIQYTTAMGLKPSSVESKQLAELPQFYADMFGWKQKAEDVAAVYNTLSPEEKKDVAIYGQNYGECGAIDYYGEKLGLPKSVGRHNNYFLWGPHGHTGKVVIIMDGEYEEHVDDFESVVQAGVSDCQYCMPYEDNMKIFIGRNFKADIVKTWGIEKNYN